MIVYKVFYKDCYHKKAVLFGRLTERRKDLRKIGQLESGLKWAKIAFGDQVQNIKRIFVVPKEVRRPRDNGIRFSGH